MEDVNICRLCLNSVSECINNLTDEYFTVYKAKIKFILPEIDLNMMPVFNICKDCAQLLSTTYKFKCDCIEIQEVIYRYMLERNTTSLNLQDVQSFQNNQNNNSEENLCSDIKNEIDVEDIRVDIKTITKQEELHIPFNYDNPGDSSEELFKIESKYLPILSSSDSISHSIDDTSLPEITSTNPVESPIVILNKKRRRKHCCPFCDQVHVNFARHLQRRHKDKAIVQEFLSLEKQSPKRKKLIAKLRQEGDFRSCNIVPVMDRNNKFETNYIPCKFCRGYYSHRTLQRHTKKCFFNPTPSLRCKAQIEGQILMSGEFSPDDILKTSGLLYVMRADATSLAAKTDPIICEVGRRYIQTHKQKGLLLVAKRKMRRLARLLIRVKKMAKSSLLTLLDVLKPEHFNMLIKATCDIAEYNKETRSFKSPSLAFQMGPLLKNAINVAFSLEIKKPDMFTKRLVDLKALTKLIEADWVYKMSREVGEDLACNNAAVEDLQNIDFVEGENEKINELSFPLKKSLKRTLVPWTKEQKKYTEEFFKNHITKKIVPKKDEVMTLISRYPAVFENRTWAVIKVYVHNQFKRK